MRKIRKIVTGLFWIWPFCVDVSKNSQKLVSCNVLNSKIDEGGYNTSEKSNKKCQGPFQEYVLQYFNSWSDRKSVV